MCEQFVVLDRDGTIIEEKHYLSDPALVVLLPGAAEGMRAFQALGFAIIVVSNQAAIGRGYCTEDDVRRVNTRMCELLAAEGVAVAAIYYCPHAPSDGCDCRKPLPGLLHRAAAEWGFDPATAIVIGDKPCDIDLGRAVGATTMLVRTGYGAKVAAQGETAPDYVVDNLLEAARVCEARLAAPAGQARNGRRS